MTPVVRTIVLSDHFPEALKAANGDAVRRAVLAAGHVLEAYAKIKANDVFSGKATNTLAGSIMTKEAKSDAHSAEVDVGPTVVYGRIHELGGIIKPVFARVLRFVIGGKVIFAKVVHMPARPYLRPAVDESMGAMKAAVEYQLNRDLTF